MLNVGMGEYQVVQILVEEGRPQLPSKMGAFYQKVKEKQNKENTIAKIKRGKW